MFRFWKRIAIALVVGLFLGIFFAAMSKMDSIKQQESEEKKQREQEQQEYAKKVEKAKKAEEKARKARERLNISPEEKSQAVTALQRFRDEDIIQKIEYFGDGLVRVWVWPKFHMMPYDWKQNLCGYVAEAYFDDVNGYIAITDGMSGNDVGSFSLTRGLKMKE
ncbi:hypothetical protein GURASL_12120 [Geotalea uraniireducens]|uniref:Uncharacterized protein n=1 Tax=Geotalea uraniireducens TaxID=351604 RepID=A0ABM8EIG2_9BACT|nr:hypothetical protein [Geotalea uraniireducens]BDV42289.1 hypothetical protein GURASL_12120 [Geotalea uraniireducens]